MLRSNSLREKFERLQKRQQTLRETNPDLPKTLEAVSVETGDVRSFRLNYFWKYGMLAIIPLPACLQCISISQMERL